MAKTLYDRWPERKRERERERERERDGRKKVREGVGELPTEVKVVKGRRK